MTQEIKAELIINGVKIVVGNYFLETIAREIPDTQENKKVFEILASSSNYEVRNIIARRENLTKKSITILLNDENQEVVNTLINNRDVNKFITDEELQTVISRNNILHLTTIVKSIDEYKNCDIFKVIEQLVSHQNSKVRYNLFTCYASNLISNTQLKRLIDDEDIDVAAEAKKELKSRIE